MLMKLYYSKNNTLKYHIFGPLDPSGTKRDVARKRHALHTELYLNSVRTKFKRNLYFGAADICTYICGGSEYEGCFFNLRWTIKKRQIDIT
jgi:hypothetical protein